MARTWPAFEYSKSKVKRAGKILREHETTPMSYAENEVAWADQVLSAWRRSHLEAENWAQMGCRSRLTTLGIDGSVTQRLKERTTIIRKLVREGTRVQLSTMEDIAGTRTVVPAIDELRRLEDRWLDAPRYPIRRHRDYVEDTPASGYRAVHLVMEHKGRLVEVQLRTKAQNAWAELVEDMGFVTGHALKNGEGPADLLNPLAVLAANIAALDQAPAMYARRQDAIHQIEQLRGTILGRAT